MRSFGTGTTLAGMALVFGVALSTGALEPLTAQERDAYRRDGTLQGRIEAARALGNHRASPARVAQAAARLASLRGEGAPSQTPPPAWRGMPTAGTVRLFALLVAFSDMAPRNDQPSIHAKLFGDGEASDFPEESLRNFYGRSSYGQLEIEGATLGWYTAPYPRRNVPQTTQGRQDLIREALNAFEAQGHDFSQYDNDGDGVIDYFLVIWTGADNGWGNFWWGYQTRFWDPSYLLDGKRLGDYSWQWEARPYPGTFRPGVTIHETGHALGLPDYYDYDDSVGPRGGVGGLDQMDANWGDHNAFSKFLLDWIEPMACGDGGAREFALGPSSTERDALLLMPGLGGGDPFGEFFVVQNRRREENDRGYPADGLLIWHVDARLNAAGTDFLYDNSYTDHKLLRLMEADGLEEIEWNGWAEAGDYYSEGKSFGPHTAPSSRGYRGGHTGVEVGSIGGGETVAFTASCAFEGPFLEFASLALEDRCAHGGGAGDGVADPGEELTLRPSLRNDGTAPVAAQAVLTSSHPGVTISVSSASYPTIGPGGSGTPEPGFTVTLGPDLPCGTLLPFHLRAVAPGGGDAWESDFQLVVGRSVIAAESFDSWPLGPGWEVSDDTFSGMPWGSGLGYGCRTNRTGGTGDFASADADCAYDFSGITTTLVTPTWDLSGIGTATLRYKTDIQDYYGTTVGTVDLSPDGGASWVPLRRYGPGEGIPATGTESVDLTPFVGLDDVRLRFRYETSAWEVWWQLDDLEVVTNCLSQPCVPPCAGTRPTVASAKYVGATKTLKVFGSGFSDGDAVLIDGRPFTTRYKGGILRAKQVPKIPRGATVEVRVATGEPGCSSDPYFYTR